MRAGSWPTHSPVGLAGVLLAVLSLTSGQYPGEASTFGTASQYWVRWSGSTDKNTSRASTLYRDTQTIEALGHLQRRRDAVAMLTTRAEWEERRAKVRVALNQTVFRGLPPLAHSTAQHRNEQWPLNATVTKVWRHPTLNFTVTMLHFESRPGFIVTAGLWEPAADAPGIDPHTGQRAGVLYASGHSCQAWRRRDYPDAYTYQYMLLHLVTKGFVVLAYDPPGQGERGMYWEGSCSIHGGCNRTSAVGGCAFDLITGLLLPHSGSSTTEHNYYARQLLLNNVTDASVWLFDGLRAMDLLASRSDLVDPTRIGMVGCSGGGTQTMYLSAFDERVAASSTACYASDFAVDFTWQGAADGEQRWPGAMAAGLNKADLSVARAPLPTHYCVTTNDACFPAQGGRLCAADAARAFSALGASANFSMTEAEGPHGMMNRTRRAVYAFFQTTLQGMVTPAPEETPGFIDELVPMPALIATPNGSVVSDLGSRTIHDLALDYTRSNVAAVAARRVDIDGFLAALPMAAAAAAGYISRQPRAVSAVPLPEAQFVGKITETAEFAQGAWVEKWVLQSEGTCGVAVTLYLPPVNTSEGPRDSGVPPATPQRDLILVTMSESFATIEPPTGPQLASTLISAAVTRGLGVALVSLCGFGEMGPIEQSESFWAPENGNLAGFNGRSTPGFHAGELTRTILWIESRPDVHGVSAIVAANHTDAAVLHAAAIDPELQNRLAALVVVGGVARYADIAGAEFYATPQFIDVAGALAAYDLPDLAAAWVVGAARSSHRARVVMLGPVDEMLHPLNATAMTTTYRFVTVAAERVAGELATVQMVAGVPSPADVVAAVLGALGPLPGSWE